MPLVRAQPPEHVVLQRRMGNVVFVGEGRGHVSKEAGDCPGREWALGVVHAHPLLSDTTRTFSLRCCPLLTGLTLSFLNKPPPELSKISSFLLSRGRGERTHRESSLGSFAVPCLPPVPCSPHASVPGVFLAPGLRTRFLFCLHHTVPLRLPKALP